MLVFVNGVGPACADSSRVEVDLPWMTEAFPSLWPRLIGSCCSTISHTPSPVRSVTCGTTGAATARRPATTPTAPPGSAGPFLAQLERDGRRHLAQLRSHLYDRRRHRGA